MKWLLSWLGKLFGSFAGQERPYAKQYVSDMPDNMKDRTIYIAGEGQYKWFVAMKCPCGCGETIQLSLEQDSSPRWQLSEHPDGAISLHPSIWRNKRCLAHFWFKHSAVEWCKGTGKIPPPVNARR